MLNDKGEIAVRVVEGTLCIPDDIAALTNMTDLIKCARFKFRDEKHRQTFVYDRFLGLVPC